MPASTHQIHIGTCTCTVMYVVLMYDHVLSKKLNIQVKKSCEGEIIIGIVKKAQESRFGIYVSEVWQIQWDSILESCFVSYVIVKTPSKPYIVVQLFSIVLYCTVYILSVYSYMQSWHH